MTDATKEATAAMEEFLEAIGTGNMAAVAEYWPDVVQEAADQARYEEREACIKKMGRARKEEREVLLDIAECQADGWRADHCDHCTEGAMALSNFIHLARRARSGKDQP